MNAQDTLMLVIAREAEKLEKLSEAAEPLIGAHLEALEVLCRCTKQLRAPTLDPEKPDEEAPSVEEDLKAVGV